MDGYEEQNVACCRLETPPQEGREACPHTPGYGMVTTGRDMPAPDLLTQTRQDKPAQTLTSPPVYPDGGWRTPAPGECESLITPGRGRRDSGGQAWMPGKLFIIERYGQNPVIKPYFPVSLC